MEWNDLEAQNERSKPKNLLEMSLTALSEYIDDLHTAIARAEAVIKSKEAARDGAESVFKS